MLRSVSDSMGKTLKEYICIIISIKWVNTWKIPGNNQHGKNNPKEPDQADIGQSFAMPAIIFLS